MQRMEDDLGSFVLLYTYTYSSDKTLTIVMFTFAMNCKIDVTHGFFFICISVLPNHWLLAYSTCNQRILFEPLVLLHALLYLGALSQQSLTAGMALLDTKNYSNCLLNRHIVILDNFLPCCCRTPADDRYSGR